MRAWPMVVAAGVFFCATAHTFSFDRSIDDTIRGITLAPIEDTRLGDVGYGSARCEVALEEATDIGATWVSLTPFGRMDDLDGIDIIHDFEIPVERNLEMIRAAAAQARAQGMKVAIIPHVYVMSGRWRGEIDPGSDARFEQWFVSYESFVSRFARLAEEIGADLFSIGVEFKSSTNFRPEQWREIIATIRSLYSGQITYSANWDEVEYVEFWDALDVIGVNAFWPLATKPGDGYEAMRARSERVARELESLTYYWNRPVVFVEFGVKTARDSALAPWEWPEHCDNLVYDEIYQAAAYQAMLEAMTPNPWFAGFFVWKYISDPFDETQETPTGFSPRGKRAEQVLQSWFSRSWDDSPFVLE